MENIFRLVSESLARHNLDISNFHDQSTSSDGGPLKPDTNFGVAPPLSRSVRQGGSVDSGSVDAQSGKGAPSLSSANAARQGGSVDSPLNWSRWFRCESSFSVLLVPAKPGIFALGEEMVPALSDAFDAAPEGRPNAAGKRMIALFHISDADDLGMALGRLFLPGNPLLAKLNAGRCFVRHAVIEDAAQRSAACAAFRRWMNASAEIASGIQQDPCGSDRPCGADTLVRVQHGSETDSSSIKASKNNSPSTSSAWGVGFMEAPNRETREVSRRPTPLPSGF